MTMVQHHDIPFDHVRAKHHAAHAHDIVTDPNLRANGFARKYRRQKAPCDTAQARGPISEADFEDGVRGNAEGTHAVQEGARKTPGAGRSGFDMKGLRSPDGR